MPRIALIVAHSLNHVIGLNNQLPWHLPADLAHFKRLTVGQTILMGRKTFESIGKALPKRHNVVLSRQDLGRTESLGITHVRSLEEALALPVETLYVIGGATLYEQLLPQADELYITLVDATITGDTFFPEISPSEWHLESCEPHPADEKHCFPFRFLKYTRI